MSENIADLATALSKAQGAMRAASKDRENPFFKSTYATLASVIEAIREPFAANALAFSQPCRIEADGAIFVETIIMHGGSGQWITSEISARPVKPDPQSVGSLVSYLKRYLLQALVGIASADDDDDGNAAAAAKPAAAPRPVAAPKAPPPAPRPIPKTLKEDFNPPIVDPKPYDNENPVDRAWFRNEMERRRASVPTTFWPEIASALTGQLPSLLDDVIADVRDAQS